ncbi:hypothetical protein CEXT_506951 [Caerostris extrusa]|uniref:Uncharacterized protein n=1 Tax=Caerostris extrusa TaxID=172846 RepID=A0AAV4MNL0_CAEEX|nr:hypothetical protein CEXT_506951 [Caerostris extrusa]
MLTNKSVGKASLVNDRFSLWVFFPSKEGGGRQGICGRIIHHFGGLLQVLDGPQLASSREHQLGSIGSCFEDQEHQPGSIWELVKDQEHQPGSTWELIEDQEHQRGSTWETISNCMERKVESMGWKRNRIFEKDCCHLKSENLSGGSSRLF